MVRSKVIICVGVPNSGKSSFVDNLTALDKSFSPISRDHLRVALNGEIYPKWNKKFEEEITKLVNSTVIYHKERGINTIIDETNCKTGKILSWINEFKDTYEVYIVVFNERMYKLLYRNIRRYLFGGQRKWIPLKVLRQMKKNFNEIDWQQIVKQSVIFSTPENMLECQQFM